MKTKKITTLGMLAALALISVLICRIKLVPAADFLTYDPKDVVIVIAGFIFGPVYSILLSVVVSLIEMLTVSDTGIIGLLMNILSTCSFSFPAALIYSRRKSINNAILGLVVGALTQTGMMLLWNYIITPIYQGVPREVVADMLLPIFMPFNLIKSGINMALTLIIYKPVVSALRKTGLLSSAEHSRVAKDEAVQEPNVGQNAAVKLSTWVIGVVLLLILIAIVVFLRLNNR